MRGAFIVGWLAVGCPKAGPEPGPRSPDPAPALATAEPDEVLDTYVHHPEPGMRGQAVWWHVWAGGGPVVDDAAWVQRAEVEALALRRDDAARARLLEIAGESTNDPWVRGLAALVHPVPAMQAALAGYRDEPMVWRRLPLALGSFAAGDAEALAVLDRDLRTGTLDWNIDLMLAIGSRGEPSLAAALAVAQQQAEPELTLALAAARLMLGDTAAAAAFGPVLRGGDVEARLEAVDLLVHVPTEQASGLLADAKERGPEIVSWYVELSGIDRGEERLARLRKAIQSDNPEVRELAQRFAAPGAAQLPWQARVLVGDKRRDQMAPIIDAGLVDADPRVRRAALRSAARLGLDVTAVARALTRDAHPQVRIAAAGYLGLR